MDKPKVQLVIDYIIEELHKSADKKLPSIRHLSRICGVSPKTAYKAIQDLSAKGLIHTKWGSGTVSADFHHTGNAELFYKSKKTLVTEKLERDLINRTFSAASQLPPIKELCNRYNISYPTMKNVLEYLRSKDLIRPSGKGYLQTENYRLGQMKIAVIGAADETGALIIEKERERNFYRQLTIEASRQNLQIELIGYCDRNQPAFFIKNQKKRNITPAEHADIHGYIIVSWHMNEYFKCINNIRHLNKPISIWVEHFEGMPAKVNLPHNQSIVFFDQSYSRQPGYDMGRYLIENGHHRVAYISPFHGSFWSKQRLIGLTEVYKAAGMENGVCSFTLDNFVSDWSFMDMVIESGDASRFFETSKLKEFNNEKCSRERMDHLLFEVNLFLRDQLIMQRCRTLLNKALGDKSITSIIAANDLCALLLLELLKASAIKVPGQISLTGFDNTFESLNKGLTSYEFNTANLVRNMIDHLLHPEFHIYKNKNQIIHLSGDVIPRKSTANKAT